MSKETSRAQADDSIGYIEPNLAFAQEKEKGPWRYHAVGHGGCPPMVARSGQSTPRGRARRYVSRMGVGSGLLSRMSDDTPIDTDFEGHCKQEHRCQSPDLGATWMIQEREGI